MGTTTTQTSEDTDADQRSLATPDSTYPRLMMHAAADAVMSAIIEYAISCGSFGLSIAAILPPDGLFGWRLNTRCTVRNAMPRAVAVPASPATPLTPVPVSPKSPMPERRPDDPDRRDHDPRHRCEQQSARDAVERRTNRARRG